MVGRISFIDKTWSVFSETRHGLRPVDFLAHLWRQSPTFQDALRRWAAENPETEEVTGGRYDAALAALLDMWGEETSSPAFADLDVLSEADRNRPIREFPGAMEWQTARESGKSDEEALALVPVDSPFRAVLEGAEKAAQRLAYRKGLAMLVDKVSFAASEDFRRAISKDLIALLDDAQPPDFEAVRDRLMGILFHMKTTDPLPQVTEGNRNPVAAVIAVDIEWILLPLLIAFHDPAEFFSEVWPRLDPKAAEEADLAELLRKWGVSVLMNPSVHERFRSNGGQPEVLRAIADLEGRLPFLGSGGRRKDKDTRDYPVLAAAYYAIPKGKRQRWIEAEAKKSPAMASTSLLRLVRKHRPR